MDRDEWLQRIDYLKQEIQACIEEEDYNGAAFIQIRLLKVMELPTHKKGSVKERENKKC